MCLPPLSAIVSICITSPTAIVIHCQHLPNPDFLKSIFVRNQKFWSRNFAQHNCINYDKYYVVKNNIDPILNIQKHNKVFTSYMYI